MIRDLVLYPDDRLRATAYDVNDPYEAVRIAQDLVDTMRAVGAHGLAAIQIGELARIIAVDRGEAGVHAYVNPRVVAAFGPLKKTREGCMSIPGVFGSVKRQRQITITAQRVSGGEVYPPTTFEVSGFEAVVWQHEIDHLNGVLFTDKMIEEV